MGNISDAIGGVFKRGRSHELPPEVQMSDRMRDHDIEPPSEIQADGVLHRFKSGPGHEKNGYYVLHHGEPSAGIFGCWKLGIEEKFVANIGRELTMVESLAMTKMIEEAKAKRKAEKSKKHASNAEVSKSIWDDATPASPDHPYLKKKGIQPHGAKATGDGRLLLPIFTPEGDLCSLQYIGDNGKRFHSGGKVRDGLHFIGPSSSRVFLVEGFADACTIVEETKCGCYIAYSGANMEPVAKTIKAMGGHSKIIVVADNDDHGKGQEYAEKAARAISAPCIVPPKLGDINDFRLSGGDVCALLEPKVSDKKFLSSFSEFCSQPAPIDWVVKGWCQKGAFHMINGPSGGGKSFVMIDMAMHVASKKEDWLGYKVSGGPVVYLAGEGHHGMRGRIAGWAQRHNVDAPEIWVSNEGCDLNTPDGFLRVAEAISSLPVSPVMIVIDTLHRFLHGDENSPQDAKTLIDACGDLSRSFGAATFLVHHTGVSELAQDRGRGSSAWRGACDLELNVLAKNEDKGEPLTLRMMKSKDAELEKPLPLNLKTIPIKGWFDSDGEQVTTAIIERSGMEAQKPNSVKEGTDKFLKYLEKAWLSSDMEWTEDGKYAVLKRQDLIDYLANKEHMIEATIKQHLKPSAKGKMVHCLVEEGKLKKTGELYILMDKGLLSIFRISARH